MRQIFLNRLWFVVLSLFVFCFAQSATLDSDLQSVGGQAFAYGDTVSILIPADVLFEPASDQFRHEVFDPDHPVLDKVAAFLRNYPDRVIKIGVGTDDVDSHHQNDILSKRQAYQVAGYLWKSGINAWQLYPLTYGRYQLLGNNETVMGSYHNRMVTILLATTTRYQDCCSRIQHFLNTKQAWQFWGQPYVS